MELVKKYRVSIGGIIILLSSILFSCNPGSRILKTDISNKELSDTKKAEYNYALTEATKQKLFGNFNQAVILYLNCISVNPNSDIANLCRQLFFNTCRDRVHLQHINDCSLEI